MIKELLETPESFKAWLESLPEEEVVGISDRVKDCPLCGFLRHNNMAFTTVTNAGIYWGEIDTAPDGSILHHHWSLAFVEELDTKWGGGAKVTAKKALEILNSVI